MNEQQQRVNGLIERIERHQAALKLSDVRFVSRYQRYLSSTDSWRRRLCARAWGEMGKNLDKWEQKLTAFVAEIDGTSDMGAFFDGMPIARYGQAAYDALQGQRNDRRVLFMIGPTGVGKSWTMRRIAAENQAGMAYIHIHRGAKDSMRLLARYLARAVGATEESGAADTFQNVVDSLKAHPITIGIDDAQDGGVLLLKLTKHLVDDTGARFMLGIYPTAWNALVNGSTEAAAEAQQLLGRAIKPVNKTWVRGVTSEDVAAYLNLDLKMRAADAAILAGNITPLLIRHGNLRTLCDAIELARMNADDTDADVTPGLVEAAVRELCPVEKK